MSKDNDTDDIFFFPFFCNAVLLMRDAKDMHTSVLQIQATEYKVLKQMYSSLSDIEDNLCSCPLSQRNSYKTLSIIA